MVFNATFNNISVRFLAVKIIVLHILIDMYVKYKILKREKLDKNKIQT
jgi:hypothetical protein